MKRIFKQNQVFNLGWLIACLLIIVSLEISTELQASLSCEPVTAIRMINFFNLSDLSGQPAEAMYPANPTFSLEQQPNPIRPKLVRWNNESVSTMAIRKYCSNYFQTNVIALFFVFYQSSRTSSEADPPLSLYRFV